MTVNFNSFTYEWVGLGHVYKINKLIMVCRTAKGNHPVTFAVAACETQNVSVTVLPSFGLSEGCSVTAKEMWGKMEQVIISFL